MKWEKKLIKNERGPQSKKIYRYILIIYICNFIIDNYITSRKILIKAFITALAVIIGDGIQ